MTRLVADRWRAAARVGPETEVSDERDGRSRDENRIGSESASADPAGLQWDSSDAMFAGDVALVAWIASAAFLVIAMATWLIAWR